MNHTAHTMKSQTQPRAVVLLSGGLDSATALAIARRDGFASYALTIRYGQRHVLEVEAARQIAQALGAAEHAIVDLDLRQFGGSALTDPVIPVPKDRTIDAREIPATYVPARNTIFLALALAWAEVLDASAVFIGVNALDYSGYPDCRPEYIAAFQRMADLATRAGVQHGRRLTIHTPLVAMSKREIIATGLALGVDFGLTLSCYDPSPEGACGRCDACRLRQKGFAEAGVRDPARYKSAAVTGR